MWKLIPVAAITIPWIALPYAPMAESINDTLKQPDANKESSELASLSMCQETDIDLYFHDGVNEVPYGRIFVGHI